MSYAAGFMLGATIGKGLQSMFAPQNNRNQCVCNSREPLPEMNFVRIHALPGRRRYKATLLINNPELAILLEKSFSVLPYIKALEIHVLTGSILVYSDDEAKLDYLEDFFANCLFSGPPAIDRRGLPKARKKICKIFQNLNHMVRSRTNQAFDLSSLLSFLFLFRGIQKTVVTGQRPSGPQLLWWALSLSRGWRME